MADAPLTHRLATAADIPALAALMDAAIYRRASSARLRSLRAG